MEENIEPRNKTHISNLKDLWPGSKGSKYNGGKTVLLTNGQMVLELPDAYMPKRKKKKGNKTNLGTYLYTLHKNSKWIVDLIL